uniref:VWA domain-containing protein n=1 Tax=Dietzia sp. TaxID=1871616 RepID=UPI002FD984C0
DDTDDGGESGGDGGHGPDGDDDSGPGPSGGAGTRPDSRDSDDAAGPGSGADRDRGTAETDPQPEVETRADSAEADLSSDGKISYGLRGVDLRSEQAGRPLLFRLGGVAHGSRGRRSSAVTTNGRSVSAAPGARGARLDLVPTVRAAAARWGLERQQRSAGADESANSGARRMLAEGDLRFARRLGRSGDLVAFCVDTSGSMAARRRLELVARSAVAVLRDSYVRRDLVGVVTAGGSGATVALAPSRSVDLAVASLGNAPTGGRTPLAEGLAATRQMLAAHRLRDPERRAIVLVLTDGRATAGERASERALAEARRLGAMDGVAPVVVDCESGRVRLGAAGRLARSMGAPVVPLEGLTSGGVAELVRAR